MKQTIQIIALLTFATITVFSQEVIDQKTVINNYDEVSRLETFQARREFLNKQTYKMRTALWQENINRKTNGVELSAEQKEIIDVIRKKFLTVEFAKSVAGKNEADAGEEYNEIMTKASQLLGEEMMQELFGILGDSKTLKKK